jgi:hypothetical protein
LATSLCLKIFRFNMLMIMNYLARERITGNINLKSLILALITKKK